MRANQTSSIDLIVAALSMKQPRFCKPTLLPGNLLGSMFYKISDSPLTTGRTLKMALRDSSFCERSIRYLQWAQIITMLRMSGARLASNINVDDDEQENYEPETKMGHGTINLFQIIQQTSDIYIAALQTPPIPFSSRINRKSAKALCQAVESPTNDELWDQCPGIFIWVLLVGCAAAEAGSTEYNYFVCLLIKVALGAGYGWLDVLTEAVKTFITVKSLTES